jgi:Ca-activated chloride channel family protein
MFRFEHIEYLWLLLGLIPALLFFVWNARWKRKQIAKLGNKDLIKSLMPDYSKTKLITKFILLSFAYVFLVLGIANPQIGTKQEKVKRSGIDVMIALDVSKSMLAEDVQPNRLSKAKNFISKFIDDLKNDRLGMIVFAGTSLSANAANSRLQRGQNVFEIGITRYGSYTRNSNCSSC